jgi:hypothetical protein
MASAILIAIEVLEALADYGVPAVVSACKALGKEGPVTMDDIDALRELVRRPETYFEDGE